MEHFFLFFSPSSTIPPYLNVRAPHAAQHKLDYRVGGVGMGQTQLLLSLTRRDSLGWPLWKREAGSAKPLHSAAQWLPAGLRPGATPSERAAKARARIEMHRKSEIRLRKKEQDWDLERGVIGGGHILFILFLFFFFEVLFCCCASHADHR